MSIDVAWIVDVVDDLEKFCRANNLEKTAQELAKASLTMQAETNAIDQNLNSFVTPNEASSPKTWE